MSDTIRKTLILFLLMMAGLTLKAQHFTNDFENRFTWYPPWINIRIVADSSSAMGHYACLCDSTQEYGLGFEFIATDTLRNRNLNIHFEADYRFPDTIGQGMIVFTIVKGQETKHWTKYLLDQYANDSAQWFHYVLDLNVPHDYLDSTKVKSFLWNTKRNNVLIDNATLTITPWTMPSFLPDIPNLIIDSLSTLNYQLSTPNSQPLTYSIGLVEEYILDSDTVTEYHPFERHFDSYRVVSGIDTTYVSPKMDDHHARPEIVSVFHRDCKLLRQAVVVPFIDSTLTVYRRNITVDTVPLQDAYYLDHEGFKVGEGDRSVIVYHENDISSLQLDAANRIAYFNIDYWRDHPMIHYPLSDSVTDLYENTSCREIKQGERWNHSILLNIGYDLKNLPRIMSIPNGYESGIIFTEHADWSDIRTHRATYFGSERITEADEAIGGYVYYGIPVTKSVFYNNPDLVTNEVISQGAFTGLHATIKTDKDFSKFLRQLHKRGYDICLHTPEQYTTTPSNLAEAMRYMRRHFKTVSWIDHGYNNGSEHNREDLVCDGLNPSSECYAADLWRKNGVKYLWNAYYEENRMAQWHFDNNLIQPYPDFGDALPNRHIGEVVQHHTPFTTWCTTSTLDIGKDNDWDFFLNSERLQRIIDNHYVFITHVYSPWVWPGRTFWTYDADSTIVAWPGMNRALERIATLRDEHKMLPMTVKTYLDYYCGVQQVSYEIIDENHIRLQNKGKKIKGFTLLCPSFIHIEDNRFYEFHKSGNECYIWFDLDARDKVTIEITNSYF